MDSGTGWAATKHGGFRRTGLAQKTEDSKDATPEARAIASADVKGAAGVEEAGTEHRPDKAGVGGSNPSPGTRFILKKEHLGMPSCPYVVRWRAETPWFSIRLHHWLAPDDDRAPHDHPWSFTTFVLRGGYRDHSPSGDDHLRAPAIRHRKALHQHTVFPDRDGAWTLVVCGPKVRSWGFWVNGKFRKANKYFLTHGHHPCQ